MARRSYQQHCGLAVALDEIGERWTLLIVRDLGPGPRRFTDLMDGLPGIATDMLADRLRSLQTAGAVEVVELVYPSPVRLYQLTERGRELSAITLLLAKWGEPLLPDERGGSLRFNPRWALQSMATTYQGGLPSGQYGWTIDGQQLTVSIKPKGKASVQYGRPTNPVLDVSLTASQFFRLARSAKLPSGVDVTGNADLIPAFFTAMQLPSQAAATRAVK
jgi:DNA-binding HxlR family transcriptional regulator